MNRPAILVVDDEPNNIETLHAILQKDYAVYFATNGEQGFDKAIEIKPDVILLDIVMPKTDG